MWKRFAKILRCPSCIGELELRSFKESAVAPSMEQIALANELGVWDRNFPQYTEAGVLLCGRCRIRFPVIGGLPVMLCYATPMHEEFSREYRRELADHCCGHQWPSHTPLEGELLVMQSFSQEWREYKYDGVLWQNSYADLERTFIEELGLDPQRDRRARYLEVGCGIGLTVELGQRHCQGDAVGVDLSFASMRATRHFRSNPFMHFVQASAFHMPFADRSFGIIYSRGVLHHTFSTREAFRAVSRLCRKGGLEYIWVYGPGSINDTPVRRAWYFVERAIRPVLSRCSTGVATKPVLSLLTVPYRVANRVQRLRNPTLQKYTYERAIHAARDRFTPRFAHRHAPDEVRQWFSEAGFEEMTMVDWRAMPIAQQDTYRRNVGIRGRQPAGIANANHALT